MSTAAEQARWAERQAARPVRVGDTIRRPAHHRSAYVDALLLHLAAAGFAGAPRPLGYDDHDRQILTFIEGEVPGGEDPRRLSDSRHHRAAGLRGAVQVFDDLLTWMARCGGQIAHG